MYGLSPFVRFTALAVTRDLKLVFRTPVRLFEDQGSDGDELPHVVLPIRNGDTVRLIHEDPGLWDFDAATQIPNGIGVGSVSAFMNMEGYAENPARLPDDVGYPVIRLCQQVICTPDANAVMNPKQVSLNKQPPHSHAATYWPTMTTTHPSASGGASATFRRLGRLLPLAMAM